MLEIDSFYFVIDSIDDKDLAEFSEKSPFLCSFNKRGDFSFPEFNIRLSDIIILHNDLLTLEEETLNNKPIENKGKFEARKGISHKKVLAKEIAKQIKVGGKEVEEETSNNHSKNNGKNHELSAHHSNDSRRTQPVTACDSGGTGGRKKEYQPECG